MRIEQKKPPLHTGIRVTIVCDKGHKIARWVVNGEQTKIIQAQQGDVIHFRIEPPHVASAILTSTTGDGGSPFGANPIDLVKNDYKVTIDSVSGKWSFAIAIALGKDGETMTDDDSHEALFPELEVGSHVSDPV